ncbi:hypothetical protein BH11PAT4_BH11PAT4_0100 [soil metagenome]
MPRTAQEATWHTFWFRGLVVAWILRLTPYIKMVGLNGSMATGTFTGKSDIDFYIVTVPGHIYLGRALCIAVTQCLGLRRYGGNVAGRICLNRFATSDFLAITPNDSYHARVFHNTFPLYASSGTYEKFAEANSWMESQGFRPVVHQVVLRDSLISVGVKKLLELLLWPVAGMLESRLEAYQQERYSSDGRVQTGDNVVVLSNQELRFHLDKTIHGPA